MMQSQPMFLRPEYCAGIESEIDRLFWQCMYEPITKTLANPNPEYSNARSALFDAVYEGIVWYADGGFLGQFNARISAEIRALGGQFNARSQSWMLSPEMVPADIRTAQTRADGRYDALKRGLFQTLADINIKSIDEHSKTQNAYRTTIEWMNGDFEKAVRAIGIPPKLTEGQRDLIARDWGQNLDLYIKNWTAENILKLRDQLQEPVLSGKRAESLVETIQQNYGVSRNKAKFLARQETSLLMSKFKESRGKAMGLRKYRWSTSHDERVRHDHWLLNGKVFFFDQPPVTNRKTGARNNPGEDFGCRCIAILLTD